MIYLIDDKKERQKNDYGWSFQKLSVYKNILKPIYSLDDLENNSKEIFNNARVIIYHESFIDRSRLSEKAVEKRNKIIDYGEKNNIYIVFFSGDSDTRTLQGNTAKLSDSFLYKNLDVFLKAYEKGDININYLLFGADPEKDKKLRQKLQENLKLTDYEKAKQVLIPNKTLFLRPEENEISNPDKNIDTEILWDVTDDYFNEFIYDKLDDNVYDNIFIPLYFGNTLSDYNGLKLATYIRCSECKNQCSNLYIYGFSDHKDLLSNKYFDILKTKNVDSIGFSKREIVSFANNIKEKINYNELSTELRKLNLKTPKNYIDNHSIANEFGIYQLAYHAGIDINEITDFNSKKLETLYFKWLIAKNGLYEKLPEKQEKENNEYRHKLRGIKDTGLKIDLSKFK